MNEYAAPSRGDQTRIALLEAAIEVFGRDGFHAASTRAIANQAGVNQALIGYHFGGKKKLYLAAFEMIAESVAHHIEPVLQDMAPELARLQTDPPDRRQICVQAMHRVFSAQLELMGSATSAPWVRLMVREQLDPTEAVELLYERVFGKLLGLLTHLVARAEGVDESAERTRLRALMLLGNYLVFLIARGTAHMHLGWTELGPAEIEAIESELLNVLQAQFLVEKEQ